MEPVQDRFALFVAAARTRSTKQFRFSILIAMVITVLLWETQWVSLRPGLFILLAGQLAAAMAYFYRMSRLKTEQAQSKEERVSWFAGEQRFTNLSALVESGVRLIGFVVLAYGFWTATHILWITLILGVVYPVLSYFGVAKRNTSQVMKVLQQQRLEIQTTA